MVIEGFQEFGARQSEVGALCKMLRHLGVVEPQSGQQYSEELLFGIGGGIGFAYFLFEKNGAHPIYLGTRIHTKETERPEFLQTICQRIGAPAHVQNSSSANAAAANMRRNLEQGRPSIVWLDEARLPYMGLTASMNTHHAVVAYGEQEDRVLLSDRCPQPVTLTREEFRVARESSWSPKYRAMLVHRSEATPDLRAAVEQGIRDCAQQMTEGMGITNFGLKGLEKWATVLTSSREKKSWLKIFPPGADLFDSLYSMFSQIRLRGSCGSALRTLYADFLDRAAEIVERPALREVASLFRHSEGLWTELADAHLPDAVPAFAELRRLAAERKTLFETQGSAALPEIDAIKNRIEQISGEMRQQFPLDLNDTKTLLGDLRTRILRLREHEAEAVRAMESALGPAIARPEPEAAPQAEAPQPESVSTPPQL